MKPFSFRIAHYGLPFLLLALALITQCSDTKASNQAIIQYLESNEIISNPERGFYVRHNWVPGTPPLDSDELIQLRDEENITIIGRSYYIEDYIDADFDTELLDLIERDFKAVRDAGAKMYFRFRYSVRIGDPDAPLERVMAHIDQLEPIMQQNYDIIAFVQGGFIGAWGEWHASTNDLTSTDNMRSILYRLMDVVPERTVGIRYPEAKMRIFDSQEPLGPNEAFDGSYRARAAHLNDCFLASPVDVGTYRIDPVWEKEYLSKENRYLPMGGETCNPRPDAGDRYHCETALFELAQMRWSYLNRDYSRRILDVWEEQGCMSEVKRRLGYRFTLLESAFDRQAAPGGRFSFDISLINNGFASPYNPRGLQLVLRNTVDPAATWHVDLPDDPRFWLGGDTVRLVYETGLPADLPEGTYDALLHLPDPMDDLFGKPDYSIRLANVDTWEPETGFNKLHHRLTVSSSADATTYSGDIIFRNDP